MSAELAGAALRRLRFSEAETRWVTTIVAGHMRPHHLAAAGQPSRRAVYRYYRDLGAAGVDTALLSLADLRATGGPEQTPGGWQRQLALVVRLLDDYFNRPQEAVRPAPLIDGHDLQTALGLRPGRQIGQLLDAVAEAQAAGELHGREQALAYAAQMVEASQRVLSEDKLMENDVCPLLGLVEEQGAYLTYPSYENRCYSSRAPQPIPLNEQTFFCLGGHQQRCPRFQSRQALLQAQDEQNAAAAAAVAGAAARGASGRRSFDWVGAGDDEPAASAEDAVAWPASSD